MTNTDTRKFLTGLLWICAQSHIQSLQYAIRRCEKNVEYHLRFGHKTHDGRFRSFRRKRTAELSAMREGAELLVGVGDTRGNWVRVDIPLSWARDEINDPK